MMPWIPAQGPRIWPGLLYLALTFATVLIILFLRDRGYALAWLPSVLLIVIKALGVIAVVLVIWAIWPKKY